jgi:oligoribonuclease NrnB/cAMP/cGMP phosphodiesterase (DHH superfamily)
MTNQKNNIIYDSIIYHNPCSDGIASAWVVKHFIPTAELIPCLAGRSPQNDITHFQGKKIIFVDLCPSKEYLENLADIADHITILDHHITAYKSLENVSHPNVNYIFDNNQSGCMITWNYFSSEPIPWFLAYIGDRDLWKWELTCSKEINTTLYDDEHTNFKGLSKLFDMNQNSSLTNFYNTDTYYSFVSRGKILYEIKDKQIKTCMKTAIHCNFDNYNIWLFTSPPDILSEVGNSLMVKNMKNGSKPHFTVCWRYNVQTHEYYISMRSSSSSIDISEICKKFGGGGHRNAAGCTLPGSTILREIFIPVPQSD